LNEEETDALQAALKLEYSYAGVLGKKLEPAIAPLGFDWKIGIALITSFAAREVFVGTMATIYSLGSDDEDFAPIRQRLLQEKNPVTGEPMFTLALCMSLLIFYVYAMQCMSTVAVVYRETKSWKWPLLQLVYMTGIAYLASLFTYNLLQ
jgi:ferrous iron transport protein B